MATRACRMTSRYEGASRSHHEEGAAAVSVPEATVLQNSRGSSCMYRLNTAASHCHLLHFTCRG